MPIDSENTGSAHRRDILAALESLVARHDRPFVVVTAPSGLFIQFCVTPRNALALDVPCGQLSEEQQRVVAEVLCSEPHIERMLDAPGGRETGDVNVSFIAEPLEPAQASRLGAELLQRLGWPDDAKLLIEKSWEEARA